MTNLGRGGRILTFYSYKGGTGRSMALANLAWILAGSGKRVLAIDWDLEAPGLHRYFRPFLIDAELSSSHGLIDLIDNYANQAIRPVDTEAHADPDWYLPYADIGDYVLSINFEHFPSGGKIDLLPAGRQGDAYAITVSSFNWQNFYDRLGGGGFIEAIKRHVRSQYDYVLIDSRTGVSDTAGICSVQMPDDLVVCFTYNNQSIKGAAAVATSALKMRTKLVTERLEAARAGLSQRSLAVVEETPRPYRVFPVPMRVVAGETDRLAMRQAYARAAFSELVEHLRPDQIAEYWRGVEVPHDIFYSYEEVLAPFKDDAFDPKTVLAAFVRLTRYLTDREVEAYRLPVAPEILQHYLEAFAETPLTREAKQRLTESRRESEEEALLRQADVAIGRLDAEERRLAQRALCRLVRVGRTEEGGGYFPIRAGISDFSDTEKAVISKLAREGLVTVSSEGRPPSRQAAAPTEPGVAIADERLLRSWKTLRDWLQADHEFLIWRQQLRTYLGDWERNGRDMGALLSGRLLSEADLWTLKRREDLNTAELDYIEASRAPARVPAAEDNAEYTVPPAPSVPVPPAVRAGGSTSWRPAGSAAATPRLPPGKRHGLIRWLATAVLLLVAGAGGFYWVRSSGIGTSTLPSLGGTPAPPPDGVVAALLEEGNSALQAGDSYKAVAAYTRAVTLDPQNAAAFTALGRTYDAVRDFAAASKSYERAVQLAPRDAAVFASRGSSRALQGDYRKALDDFSHAIELQPDDPALYLNRGVARQNLDDTAGALADYTEAVRRQTDSAQAYLRRAELHEKRGDRRAAIADYRSILALKSTDPDTRTVAEVRLTKLGVRPTLEASASPRPRERVVVHYRERRDAEAAQQLMRQLSDELKGVSIPEPVPASAPSDGDVRYFFREDEKLAQRVKLVAESALARLGYRVSLQVLYRVELRQTVRSGSVEIWLPPLSRPALAR